jgi:hypothetical protein
LADELVRLTEHDSISRETVRRRLTENDLKPWRKDMWCIPHIDGEYVARIEDVLDLYAQVLIGKTIDSGVIVFFLGTWRRHHWAFRSAHSGQGDDNRGADSAAAREPIHSSGWPASRASDRLGQTPTHLQICSSITGRATDASRLPRLDGDLDCGVQPEIVVVTTMMLRIPVPNPPPDLAEKVETALLSQVSEIADQVCDGVLVTSAAAPLENRDRLGSPGDVVGFIGHLSPRIHDCSTINAGSGSRQCMLSITRSTARSRPLRPYRVHRDIHAPDGSPLGYWEGSWRDNAKETHRSAATRPVALGPAGPAAARCAPKGGRFPHDRPIP